MATMTLNLAESDINEAIQQWAASQGFTAVGIASIHYTPGDRPGEIGTCSATIEVVPAAPTPARKRSSPAA